jgi:hypothetical protein
MAVQVRELKEWLIDVNDNDYIGIDEGGLTLKIFRKDAYYEIGGLPEEE